MTEFTKEWLHFAEMDIRSANFLLAMRPVPIEIICYHCQQCAEKALKAVLVEHDMEPLKTHDLRELCQMCAALDPVFQDLTAPFRELTSYGVAPRYPNGPELDDRRMNEALRESQKILAFVQSVLEEGVEP